MISSYGLLKQIIAAVASVSRRSSPCVDLEQDLGLHPRSMEIIIADLSGRDADVFYSGGIGIWIE